MKIHLESVHEGKKPHVCSFCTASFGVKSNLTRHIKQVHEEQKIHQCTVCDASFHQKNGLYQHISAVHEKAKPFSCEICHMSFARKQRLVTHSRKIHQSYDDNFDDVSNENQNMDENFEGFSYENQISGEQFENYENNEYSEENVAYENEYEEYIETVDITAENEQKNQCSLCGKSFPKPSKLKLHIATVHEGQKSFECSTCQSSFKQNGHLKAHIESVHEGKKPFHCTICDSSFRRNTHLTRHIASVHDGKKQIRKRTSIISDILETEVESDENRSNLEEGEDYPMSVLEIKQENLNESDNFSQDLQNHEPIECSKIIKIK